MIECICTPDAEDVNGGLREDCSVHGDDYCPDCRTRLEQLWYFVAEDGLHEMQADWEKRCRRCAEEQRNAVLKAAMELIQEDDLRIASVDRISARSGVSKATIYKWWPNRTAVAIDAFLHQMMTDAPVPDTGSAAEDFRHVARHDGVLHQPTWRDLRPTPRRGALLPN